LRTFTESLEADDGGITFNYGLPLEGAKQKTVSVLGIVTLNGEEGTIPRTIRNSKDWSGKVFSINFPWLAAKGQPYLVPPLGL